MTQPGPALLAYDGSPSSATAIAVAGRLATRARGRAYATCGPASRRPSSTDARDPAGSLSVMPPTELDEFDSEAAAKVAADGVELARSAGFEAQPSALRRQTKTWRAILDAADESGAAVLVCGAHGISGVGRAVLGSVSDQPGPPLANPDTHRPGRPHPGKRYRGAPLLCYDGSDGAKTADRRGRRDPRCPACARVSLLGVVGLRGAGARGSQRHRPGHGGRARRGRRRAVQGPYERGHRDGQARRLRGEGLSERAPGPIWMAALDAADAARVRGDRRSDLVV